MKNEEHKKEVGENKQTVQTARNILSTSKGINCAEDVTKKTRKHRMMAAMIHYTCLWIYKRFECCQRSLESRLQFLPREFAHIMRVLSRSEKEKD